MVVKIQAETTGPVNMELGQLRDFIKIVESGSMNRAAIELEAHGHWPSSSLARDATQKVGMLLTVFIYAITCFCRIWCVGKQGLDSNELHRHGCACGVVPRRSRVA